jgi:hypothetical protein
VLGRSRALCKVKMKVVGRGQREIDYIVMLAKPVAFSSRLWHRVQSNRVYNITSPSLSKFKREKKTIGVEAARISTPP